MRAAELFVEVLSDPKAAQEAAREMALRSDLTTNEVKLLRGILQPWWENERDARVLCGYVGAIALADGKNGGAAHRRSVRIAVICGRTALALVHEENLEATKEIFEKIDTWSQNEAPNADLQALKDQSFLLWIADPINGKGPYAAIVEPAKAAIYPADSYGSVAFTESYEDIEDHIEIHPCDTPEWNEARDRHLSELADLIRREITVCPVGLR